MKILKQSANILNLQQHYTSFNEISSHTLSLRFRFLALEKGAIDNDEVNHFTLTRLLFRSLFIADDSKNLEQFFQYELMQVL